MTGGAGGAGDGRAVAGQPAVRGGGPGGATGPAAAGWLEEALDCQRSSLAIHSEVSEPRLVGVSLHNSGATLLYLKRHDEALDHFLRALAIARDGGDRYHEGINEAAIGETCLTLGRYGESAEHYRRSWAALQETVRDTFGNADTLYGLGTALAALGRADEAREAGGGVAPASQPPPRPRP
jgi:tetratricopeptide (TPR) repeat protein